MNNEQFERRMEFILEQQAQFAVDIHQLKEAQTELTRKHNNLTDALTTVVGMVGKLAEGQQRTDEQISALTTRQAETDDRLNVVITAVERFISRNGRKSVTKKAQVTTRKTKPPRKR